MNGNNLEDYKVWDEDDHTVYLVREDGSMMQVGAEDDFNQMAATIYAESSGNETESMAIGNVIQNRADYTGNSTSDIIETTGIYGYGSNNYNQVYGATNNENTNYVTARASAINAMMGGNDYSNAAYFWEATTYITPGLRNYDTGNFFVRMGWGNNVGTTSGIINYNVATTIGATTFMINNPTYHGTRRFP